MNRYSHKGLPLLKPSRALRFKRRSKISVTRIFLSFLVVAIVTYVIFASGLSAQANEAPKASGIVFEEAQGSDPLSFTKKSSPHSAKTDSCLSLLHASRLSIDDTVDSRGQPLSVDKHAASVVLGLFLGLHIALNPKDKAQKYQRVNIRPEFRATDKESDQHALAIAFYRRVKNDHDLEDHQKNNLVS